MSNTTYGGGIVLFTAGGGGGGGVTGAESGTGIVSGKVRLGINPLLQPTGINCADFLYQVAGINGTGVSEAVQIIQGSVMRMDSYDASSNKKEIGIDSGSGIGIDFSDAVDNIGPSTQKPFGFDPFFHPTFDPVKFSTIKTRQFLTQDYIPYIRKTTQARLISGVGSNFFTVAPASLTLNVLVRLNIAIFISSLGASTVNVSFAWTDEGSTSRTTQVATYTALGAQPLQPFVFYLERGSAPVIDVNINVPGAQVNMYAMMEILNVMN